MTLRVTVGETGEDPWGKEDIVIDLVSGGDLWVVEEDGCMWLLWVKEW